MLSCLALTMTVLACAATGMRAQYIGAVPGEGRSPLLRKVFSVRKKGEQALLYVNSLGYHEAYLNGQKVTDAVLMPAVSQLDKRSLIVTYDVTRLLRKGKNELRLMTSCGWYKPQTFGTVYDGPLVRAQLDVVSGSENIPVVWTDASWQGTWSGYSDLGTWRPHLFAGELIDARAMAETRWQPVDVVEVTGITASPQLCEPCRVQETITPVSIKADGEGRWIVDFGRIVNAMLDCRLPALPAGHVTTASFSDFIKPDGSFDVGSRNVYISSGKSQGDRFVNRFNHHVFRYVLLDSLPVRPDISDLRALRMRTDFTKTASFSCSDEELNKIHDMVAYTLENLTFNGYMVDCANIERLGYGGDGNASTPTLQILFDVRKLYDNWLLAWRDVMHDDGGLPHTAPCPYPAGGGPYWCSFIVQAPWRTYLSYGDVEVLRQTYPSMKKWLQYVDKYTVDGLLRKWPDTDYRNWYLGDWAAPEGVDVMDTASVDLVNNCAMCQVYTDLQQIAMTLGMEGEAADYRQRYEALAKRINEEFLHAGEAVYASGSQIDMAYPLLVGIVPDSLRKQVRDQLVGFTENRYNGHLATGLVGVPVVTEWATMAGECDWMYGMLKQHGYPGYLYMIDQGATATWEHWNGERSRMHNCFNGIGTWFYQALGGIVPVEPGYRSIRIEPQVPKGLEWVRVSQTTPCGTITVYRNGRQLHVELPEGITATIQGRVYKGGVHDFTLQ